MSPGFVGGSLSTSQGAGSNHLCMRSDPKFRPTDEDRGDRRAEMHGVEYADPPKSLLNEHEVPCAVCAVTRWQVLMMPGTNLCNEGWTTEYVGYIAAERTHESHYRTEFICLDDDVEPTTHSSPGADHGAVLYPAQAICGSLPCLPYVEGKDVLCVVCSR